MPVSDVTGSLPNSWVRLPPPDVLAVVVTAPVPDIPPSALRDVLEPAVVDRHVTGWALADIAGGRPEVFAEYWAWRRTWSSTWSMGPADHLRALLDTVARLHLDLGATLPPTIRSMCRAEHDEEALPAIGAEAQASIIADLADLRTILASVANSGGAIIDDMGLPSRGASVLRTWPDVDEEVILAANDVTSVVIEPGAALSVIHGEPVAHAFRDLLAADLTGERVLLVDATGDTLGLTPSQSRPLAWLAPGSLRWHVERIALVEVWRPLFDGLPAAIAAARSAGTGVRFTSRFVVS